MGGLWGPDGWTILTHVLRWSAPFVVLAVVAITLAVVLRPRSARVSLATAVASVGILVWALGGGFLQYRLPMYYRYKQQELNLTNEEVSAKLDRFYWARSLLLSGSIGVLLYAAWAGRGAVADRGPPSDAEKGGSAAKLSGAGRTGSHQPIPPAPCSPPPAADPDARYRPPPGWPGAEPGAAPDPAT